jgi:hypothetical protein
LERKEVMSVRRIVLCVVGALAVSLLVGAPNAVAANDRAVGSAARLSAEAVLADGEVNYAIKGTGGPGVPDDWCINWNDGSHYFVFGCFQKYGDRIWVQDAYGDGYPVAIYWQNYIRDDLGNWVLHRWGECRNYLYAPNWGYCDKDFWEDQTYPNARGGQGSGIRLYPCIISGGYTGCLSNYKWLRNNE